MQGPLYWRNAEAPVLFTHMSRKRRWSAAVQGAVPLQQYSVCLFCSNGSYLP